MKFLCFLFLLSVSVSAASYSQSTRFTLALENVALTDVFSTIRKSSEYTFIYNMDDVRNIQVKSLDVKDASLQEVLDKVLRNTGFAYKIEDQVVVIQPQDSREKKNFTRVKGWVYDKNKEPIPGVTVRLVGVSLGTATNLTGWFAIDLPVLKGELEFSFVGYKKQRVNFTEKTDTLRIVMEEDLQQVDEVVVTGIFNKPKESFTGAVTSVSREELKAKYSRNMLQTLANIDPSFRIIQNNEAGSDPNTLPTIQLRGASTLASVSDMQFATRSTLNYPLFILDGFEVTLERVMDLNESEVENITLLKDAGATSLYGSRGANGVVVITTTRPTAGKLRVSYNGSLRLEITDFSSYNRMNAREKFELEKKYGVWDSPAFQEMHDAIQASIDRGEDYNWLKVPVRTGVGQVHRLNFIGGADEWRFRFDLSYDSNVGVMKGSERNNYNGTLEVNYETDKWFVVQSFGIGVNTSSNSSYGAFSQYASMNPYWNPFNEDGSAVEYFYHPMAKNALDNPLYDWSVGKWNESKYSSFRSNTSVRYTVVPSFQLVGSVGLSRQISQNNTFTPPSHKYYTVKEVDQKGRYERMDQVRDLWQTSLTMNYTETFKDKHMLTVNLNGEVQEDVTNLVRWAATGFVNDAIDNIGTSLGYPESGGTNGQEQTSRRISFRGSVNYYYDMRYFLDVSYSTDGSSSFGEDSRWGSFYSFGGGWNIYKERFFQEYLGFISDFRVRYSYGVSGNMGFSPQDAMGTYILNVDETYLSALGAQRGGVANPYLKWQNTYQHNVGGDLNFFSNRLQVQFNYFSKLTNNTVADIFLPISHGKEKIKGNVGKIRNEGYDLNVTAYLIRNTSKGMMWSVTGRFNRLKNTLVKMSKGLKETLQYSSRTMDSASTYYRYIEGHSMDAIFGLRTVGVDPQTGYRLYLTKDGGVSIHQNPDDMVYLGDRQPKVNGNISTSFSYKGLNLNVGFNVKWGGYQENFTELVRGENLRLVDNVDKRAGSDRWEKPGDKARYKKYGTISTFPCDMFVQKDNIFSCSNINLSYAFPRSFCKKYLGMESLSVSAYLSDIFYFSTIKRERGTNYPFSINPNFSISCSF